jgi:hypothetical protein
MAQWLPTRGTIKRPMAEVDGVLAEIARKAGAEETRSTAQLALGVLAKTLARQDPRRAAAIVDWALEEMKKARTEADKRQMLLVLGNTGAAETLGEIQKHLSESDAGVRGAAVAALRWHAGVDAALCQALTSDVDASVRQEAAQAFEVRTMTEEVVKAHVQAFRKDPATAVRLGALNNLARMVRSKQEVRTLIEEAAKGDKVKEVRERAQAILAE